MGRQRWCVAILAVAAILAGTAGCGGRPTSEEEATPTPIPTAVIPSKPTYRVERGTVVDSVSFSGRVAPVQEEQLFFRVDGRVSKVAVEQGDRVRKGDLLAELDIADLLNQLAQAKVTLEAAQLKLASAQAGAADQRATAEVNLEIARLKLAQARVQDPAPNVAIAAANRDKALAALELAQAAYDRRAAQPGAAASPEALALQRATQDVQVAEAQYQLALQSQRAHEYDLQILEQNVRLAELALARAGGTADPALVQEVAKAQLVVDRLSAQVESARLVSPLDGEVTMVAAYAGRTISAYSPAIIVAAPGALEVSADLLSETMQKLSVGQACTISLINSPGKELHGTIRRLPYPYGTGGSSSTTAVGEDRTTRISIDDAAGVSLERGALVRVTVTLQRKEGVLWLPPAAIRTFSGKDFVLVLSGEGQQRVPVKVGIRSEERCEIESGVSEGQVVVGP